MSQSAGKYSRFAWCWCALGLMALCAALRMPGLLALPIFGDESIYLRWAQVIRGGSIDSAQWWVSLVDPKPPLHFWLLALVFHWSEDPLLSARLLSVGAGIAAMPLFLGIGAELGAFLPGGNSAGRRVGLAAAVLALFCPFLAFYQRLATADALFVTESMLVIYLSLRWARFSVKGGRRDGKLTAVLLGLAIGAGLLTRQGISYTICAFPVLALLAQGKGFGRLPQATDEDSAAFPGEKRHWPRSLGQLAVAALVAAALWIPYLTAELAKYAVESRPPGAGDVQAAPTGGEVWTELRRRIMYQAKFTDAGSGRGELAKRNAFVTFVPGHNEQGQPNSGWLPLYMTPGVFGVSVLGFIYALRRPRVFLLLLAWLVLLLGPVIFLGETVFSRYVLAAVPPLLVGGGMVLGDVTAWLLARRRRARIVGVVAGLALWAGLSYWPAKALATQAFSWRDQVLTERLKWGQGFIRGDRYQYVTGWTAGLGTRDAIAFLISEARRIAPRPMVVITTAGWGTPADAVWVYLSREANVQLYWVEGTPRPEADGTTYLLHGEKWLPSWENVVHAVQFSPGTVVYYVANDPVHANVDIPLMEYLREVKANFGPPKSFNGVDDEGVKVLEVVP